MAISKEDLFKKIEQVPEGQYDVIAKFLDQLIALEEVPEKDRSITFEQVFKDIKVDLNEW